ncbi:MAG: DNA primase, partial [Bifidobacteriaceae bacterium]|nr:DNA primase [Bifidobacteriaceae bacterium]
MAQIISNADISELRTSADILDIIGKHITLKTAGIGRYKGLCPFHDEKTPSFTVSPQTSTWHCFGCGAHGDIYAFFMKLNGLSFPESVQYVASLAHFELHFTQTKGGESSLPTGGRQKLLDANKVASDFFINCLSSPNGEKAREILKARKFNDDDIKNYCIGYAPDSWSSLTKHLQDRGFTNNEIENAGLAISGTKGLYDRFRHRIMWPIFDLSNQVIAFGGRAIESEKAEAGAKYLNTNETKIYKKSQILYGLNWAKKSIAKHKQVIIVEGYTDVMAMHIAGYYNTVGTCGTAFANSHAKL